MKLEIVKGIREDVYVEYKEMILSFDKKLRQDPTLVALLLAVLLFRPDRPNIQHRTTLMYIQKIYCYLLKKYIFLHISKDNLPIYEKLMQNLEKLRALHARILHIYLELNSANIPPLLVELFEFGCWLANCAKLSYFLSVFNQFFIQIISNCFIQKYSEVFSKYFSGCFQGIYRNISKHVL